MFKISHTVMITLSGLIWLAIGVMLLSLGLNFIVDSILKDSVASMHRPLLDIFGSLAGGYEQAAILVIALALLIGFAKGRFVFAKTVGKTVARILALPNPAPLSQIYTKGYYILLAGMVFLGFLVRFFPFDIRGFIDVIIGSALINGSLLYFRQALAVRKQTNTQIEPQ